MKSLKRFIAGTVTAIFFLTGMLAQPLIAQQDSASVRALLDERDRQIKELLGPEGTDYTEEQRQQLKDMINGVIDYEAMARYALQETWDTLSAEKRQEFTDLFSTIVRDQSLSNLEIYRADVEYREIAVSGDSAEVRTIATLENTRTPVTYNMMYTGEGEWMVVDMAIDDVYTAESYRNQFQRIINRRGFDGLMETLRKRAAR